MAKQAVVHLRITDDLKKQLAEAASRSGKSLSSFMIEAAQGTARKSLSKPTAMRHGGVPSFFRGRCQAATSGGSGYSFPAYELCRHLGGSEMPYDADLDEWEAEIERLAAFVQDGDDDAVLAWFDEHYPKCMELIPRRRRTQFVVGVQQAFENEIVEV